MCTLEDVINQLKEEYPGLVHMKIPTCNSAAPSEADFDIIRFNIDFNFNETLHNGKSDRKAYKLQIKIKNACIFFCIIYQTFLLQISFFQ